ncbi:CopD family protein [Pseudomonas knackmussii]|uniref:Protoporphyrinogen IX oxidase n=1 Tax=Pseudomonas knackmussii TaxID=65741 RepID=A0ABY4KNX7_9PSED|nr:CopD family protein [Pseudomonas knackmussii]UPQ81100.1 CopD family protein [Pseudomonas knackmussii]
MPLLKLLHFAALLCWCGTLLYLPALIAAGTRRSDPLFYRDHAHLTRMVFNLVGTPAALIAIGSGTALFLRDGIMAGWLIVKLSTVAGMVLCHALCGVLVLHIERSPEQSVSIRCRFLGAAIATFITATLWLVLAKPF